MREGGREVYRWVERASGKGGTQVSREGDGSVGRGTGW